MGFFFVCFVSISTQTDLQTCHIFFFKVIYIEQTECVWLRNHNIIIIDRKLATQKKVFKIKIPFWKFQIFFLIYDLDFWVLSFQKLKKLIFFVFVSIQSSPLGLLAKDLSIGFVCQFWIRIWNSFSGNFPENSFQIEFGQIKKLKIFSL